MKSLTGLKMRRKLDLRHMKKGRKKVRQKEKKAAKNKE